MSALVERVRGTWVVCENSHCDAEEFVSRDSAKTEHKTDGVGVIMRSLGWYYEEFPNGYIKAICPQHVC